MTRAAANNRSSQKPLPPSIGGTRSRLRRSRGARRQGHAARSYPTSPPHPLSVTSSASNAKTTDGEGEQDPGDFRDTQSAVA
ncbi:MAG: hypothetical protein IPM61_05320 [Chlorobi bacterium]|nr:hypothetical protein [Chlorobiota bacterium]MBX7217293.1 hypothetical protein [Candidatus Kapabacteria bacterium]